MEVRLLQLAVLLICLILVCICGEAHRVCSIACCTAEPSCSGALRVTCDCPDDIIFLKAADIPKSVRAVQILKAKKVTIGSGAISGLPHLNNFSVQDIDNVDIEQGGMTLQKHSKLRLVRIEKIGTLRINSDAFNGTWEQRLIIKLRGVAQLHVRPDAFSYDSKRVGTSLVLQNIRMFALAPKGFKAPVAQMSLENVEMEACHGESFGGNIRTMKFNNVTIAEAKARCVTGLSSLSSLSVQSSKIGVMHPQAFSGQLSRVTINDSDFLTMHERSLDLRVAHIEIKDLFVRHISSNGMSVEADESIRLEKIRVESLKKNAFAGLHIVPTPTGYHRPLIMKKLEIVEPEPGSLTFSECTDVQMTDLDLVAPWPRVCPTERWTRALSEGPAGGPLSPAQLELFFQLYARGLCDEDDRLPMPRAADRPRCAPAHQRQQAAGGGRGGPAGRNRGANPSHEKDRGSSHRAGGGTEIGANTASGGSRNGTAGGAGSVVENGKGDGTTFVEKEAFEYLVDYNEEKNKFSSRDARQVTADFTPTATEASVEALRGASGLSGGAATPPAPGPGGAATPPAPGPAGDAADQHRLLLYLALGAVLALAAVLGGALLLLLARRRRRRAERRQPPAVEELLMAMANRLLRREGGGAGRQRAGSESSGFSSGRASVDSHQYEPIRRELLAPPAGQLICLDDSPVRAEGVYHSLMER